MPVLIQRHSANDDQANGHQLLPQGLPEAARFTRKWQKDYTKMTASGTVQRIKQQWSSTRISIFYAEKVNLDVKTATNKLKH